MFGVRSGYSAFVLRYFSSESACAECAQCSQVGPLCFEFGNNDISATSAAWKNAQCPACICQGHHIVTAAFLDTAFEALAIFMLGAAISCAQAGFSPGGELAVRTYEIYTALPSRSSRSKSGTVEQNAGLDVACPILNIMVNSLIACLLVFLASWGGFVFTNKTSDTSTLTFVSTLYYLAVVALSLMVLIIAAIALRYAMSADERQIQQSRKGRRRAPPASRWIIVCPPTDIHSPTAAVHRCPALDNQGDANDMQQARRYLCLSLCAALVMEMMCQVAALLGHANCKDSKPMALLDVFMVFRLVAVMALFWCERNKHKR